MRTSLEIVRFIFKKPYCKIEEIEDKIRSLTKDMMNMIYIVAAGKDSSFYDLQGDAEDTQEKIREYEEELKQIREKAVMDVSEKVREYILNNLLPNVSRLQDLSQLLRQVEFVNTYTQSLINILPYLSEFTVKHL
jgi:hypothetical protein